MPIAVSIRIRVRAPLGLLRASTWRCPLRVGFCVLYLLCRLPEKQVGADRRAQEWLPPSSRNSDAAKTGARTHHTRPHSRAAGRSQPPRSMKKRRKCQPLEDRHIPRVFQENLPTGADGSEQRDQDPAGHDDHTSRVASAIADRSAPTLSVLATKSSPTIDRSTPVRIVLAQVAGNAAPGRCVLGGRSCSAQPPSAGRSEAASIPSRNRTARPPGK